MWQWGNGAMKIIPPFPNSLPHCLIAPLLIAVVGAACSRSATPINITLVPAEGAAPAFVRVSGLSSAELSALRRTDLAAETWDRVLRVTVASAPPGSPAVAGHVTTTASSVEFRPLFPFDPGREYLVRFDPAALPTPRAGPAIEKTAALPAVARTPSTTVVRMLPGADVLPANLLRVYLEFSAPMSRENGRDHIHLIDDRGRAVPDVFLSLDVEFWSPDYQRYTVFFDPGRVKRGILPNEKFGRALEEGKRFTLTVDAAWRDASGQPLQAPFSRSFRVGPPDLAPIRLEEWRLQAPSAGSRSPLVVAFPKPLDAGLLERAIGVAHRAGEPVAGRVVIVPLEKSWTFTPRDAWRAGDYELIVLSILEDPCGNRVGRPFDIDTFEHIDRSPEPERRSVPFKIE
jgi:hypothetical protein